MRSISCWSFADCSSESSKRESLEKTLDAIRSKYGKDAVLKGMNFNEGATTIERNHQIGGHKDGT